MTASARSAALWGLAVLLVAAVLLGQAAADSLLPPGQHGDTAKVMGRSGFAYLTGIRTYIAAVLWSRLEPIDHTYYGNSSLGQKRFLLPSINLVTWLDPTFEEAYYVGPFVLYEAGQKQNANRLAEEGVRVNPQSALLHASFAQLLLVQGRMSDARRQADVAVRLEWRSEEDKFSLFAPIEIIYRQTGSPDKAAEVAAERSRLRAKLGRPEPLAAPQTRPAPGN